MKLIHFIRFLGFSALAAAVSVVHAQPSEAQSVSAYVRVKGTWLSSSGGPNYSMITSLEQPNGTFANFGFTESVVATGNPLGVGQAYSNIYTGPQIATFDVGRTYWLQVGTVNISSMSINVNPPAGYQVHFLDPNSKANDNETREYNFPTTVQETGWDGRFGSTIGMVILPDSDAAAGGQAGTAGALSTSGGSFRIFMGYLPNGNSAGYLQVTDRGRAAAGFTDAFNSDAVTYTPPSPEITVFSDGSGGRRIFAYEAGVAITPLASTNGFTISFYSNSQITDNSVTGPAFSGSAFMTYTFEEDGGDPTKLKIIRAATGPTQTITKVANVQRTGSGWPNYTFTLTDWHTDGQSGIVTVATALSGGSASGDHQEAITLASTAGGSNQVSSMYVTAEPFGEAPTSTQKGSTTPESASITYYQSDPNAVGAYGRPKLIVGNNGSWTGYEYYSTEYSGSGGQVQFSNTGMVQRSHRPFLNTAAPAPTDDLSQSSAGVVTTYQYQSDTFSQINGLSLRPSDELTQIGGVTVAHNSTTYTDSGTFAYAGLTLPIVTATRTDFSNASASLTTITKYIREYDQSNVTQSLNQWFATSAFWRKQLLSVQKPDGSKQSYAYQRGTYSSGVFTPNTSSSPFDTVPGVIWHWADRSAAQNPSAASRVVVINGTAKATNSDGTSNTSYTNYAGFPVDSLYLVDGKSTMDVTIRDLSALVRHTEKWAWVGGAFQLVSSEDLTYDTANNLISKVSSNGATYSATYDGGRKITETDASGIATNYSYDDAGRVSNATKVGVTGQANLLTDFTYDAAGRTVKQDVHAAGGSEHIITSHTYDDAGRVASEAIPGHGTTNYTYSPTTNTVTATLPNTGTRIETSNPDGQKASTTGTAVVAQYFTYDIAAGGNRHTKVSIGSSTSTRIQETWTDWLGRTYQTSHPTDVNGVYGSLVETRTYDPTTGLLTTSRRADGSGNLLYADTYYSYDSLGQQIRTGSDINGDKALTTASSDRITDTNQYYELYQSAYWLTKQTLTYPTLNSGASQQISLVRQRLTGFSGTLEAETQSTDVDQNVTDTQTLVNRASATVTAQTTSTGFANTQSTVSVNGLLSTVSGFDGLTTTTKYDSLQRANEVDDPINRATTTTFVTGTTLPYQVTDPALNNVATYAYDTAGRVSTVANAVGNVTRTDYDTLDHVIHQWGDGAFPVMYGYDSLGERTTMSTYRAGSGWSGTTWPTNPGAADTTTWAFDPTTGVLTSKTDASNQQVQYAYNGRGQTYTRTWARGVMTTYGYDSNTGELTSLTYSDSTPGVTYTYNRSGTMNSVSDATGQRNLVYDPVQTLRLNAADLPAFYGSRVLTRNYDSIFRPAGFLLGNTSNLSADLNQTYNYNTLGRFDHLTSVSAVQPSREFDYTYNSVGLVSGLAVAGSPFAVSRGYEANRNLLTSIATTWNTTATRTRYDYTYDQAGRRATSKQSGDAYADFGGSTYYRFTYDSRSEITDATDYQGEDPTSTSSPQLSGRHHAFSYDSIGNRQTSSRTGSAGTPDNYYTNALNQYSSRTNNYTHTAGTVGNSSISVGVSGSNSAVASAVAQQGRYWDAQLLLNNGAAPASSLLTITATGTASGGGTIVTTDNSRTAYLPTASQSFTYDVDGNLIGDGLWSYTYDAENRLISMSTLSAATKGGYPNQSLDFQYDYANRRVQKHVKNTTAGTETWRRYLYDGDNLVAEFDAPSGTSCGNLLRSYTWGLDLSGTLTATGGVGALVQITDHSTSVAYYPTYDGNGNIAALLQVADGNGQTASTAVAKYEYTPFGELLRTEGTYALSNPWRFSSKFFDVETSLVYYGHRYYDPRNGRFINRDPIEEAGGLDLYGFCLNDPVDKWDVLGNRNSYGEGERESAGDFARHLDGFRTVWVNPDSLVQSTPVAQTGTPTGNEFKFDQQIDPVSAYFRDSGAPGGNSPIDPGETMANQELNRQLSGQTTFARMFVPGLNTGMTGFEAARMTGSAFVGWNAAVNPAYGVFAGVYESKTGLSVNPNNAGDRLGTLGRTVSGISAAANAAAIFGLTNLSLKSLSLLELNTAAETIPNRFAGVQQASKYLQEMGVPRARRVEILQSFEVDAMRVRAAGQNEFGLRYFSDPNRAGGSYLFETFPASRESLAIKPEWSSMSGFRQFQVRPGATILEGPAAAQGLYLQGGQTQKFILNWRADLLGP